MAHIPTVKDWFDEHVIIDFGDFNNKEDKKKADDLKQKLKEKLEEELRDEVHHDNNY